MGHHYVPQEYLRAFQTDRGTGEIWLYDKHDRASRILPIRNVAQSPKFYDDDVEEQLALVEGRGHAVLKQVRASARITSAARAVLAYYVAIMLYRTPRQRRKNIERIPAVREQVLGNMHATIERWAATRPLNDPLVERRRQELRDATEKFRKQPPNAVTDKVRSPWPSKHVVDLLMRKTWRILLTAPTVPFVTSDNPAVFLRDWVSRIPTRS